MSMNMNRTEFHKAFHCPGPVVTPVVHVLDIGQVARNIELAIVEGVAGVFLINHDFPHDELVPIVREVRRLFPSLWLGVNFLGVSGADAFPVLGELERDGVLVDAYWSDDARLDERNSVQHRAQTIQDIRVASGWTGMYFGGVAFKKQRPVDPEYYPQAANLGAQWLDVVTTSGMATGESADSAKISAFRRGIEDRPMALASGVSPENVEIYAPDVDCFLVATGINRVGDFYHIDRGRLHALLAATREYGARV
jgi:predicted TIM-barrel enzyme